MIMEEFDLDVLINPPSGDLERELRKTMLDAAFAGKPVIMRKPGKVLLVRPDWSSIDVMFNEEYDEKFCGNN